MGKKTAGILPEEKTGSVSFVNGTKEMMIQREFYKEGMIVRDDHAFYSGEGICYVSEISDEPYTRKDFLDLCNGQEEIAEAIYMGCTWMTPEALLEDLKSGGDILVCPVCGRLYLPDDVPGKCLACNADICL